MPRSKFLDSALFASVLAGSLVLSLIGCAGSPSQRSGDGQGSTPAQTQSSRATYLPHPAFAQAGANGASIADIAERALPSVVSISSTKVRRTDPQRRDPVFRHFFGPDGPREQREQGLGSGVIVSNDGVVLTNSHVVEQADEITVTTYDQREFSAKVVGTDPKSDLAVIKLNGASQDLKPIELGDSSRLRLGDVVLAIGNPFGVGQTVTMGIVSAKGRANVGIVDYEDFIQTDAAVNPGNSGGALVNMEGKLVGVNTAILSRTGGSLGIGFAIPTNMARPIMESLQKHGKVVRGWLGVSIQDVQPELAGALGLPATTRGVLISDVSVTGPGARGGVLRGDVIQKVNGTPVGSTGELRNAIAQAGSGTKAKLDILRDGKPRTLELKLGEMPNEGTAAAPNGAGPAGQGDALDGLTLESLSAAARQRLRVPDQVRGGVVVTDVDPSSPAARAGLRPGDVLVEVNRQKIDGVERFKALYTSAKGSVLLLVRRQATSHYVVVRR